MMEKILQYALTANASSMAFNWIYNPEYLTALSKKQSLLFQPVLREHYVKSEKSYFAYPHATVGSVSYQGEILKWLIGALKDNPDLTAEGYLDVVYEMSKPGGDYQGFVETYVRSLIIKRLAAMQKFDIPALPVNDDNLVGFIPYVAVKSLKLPLKKAVELTRAFTDIDDYETFFYLFDEMLEGLESQSMQDVIAKAVEKVPSDLKTRFEKALTEPSDVFIKSTVNTACHYPHAVPLIFHILYKTNSLEAALDLNARLGGASCDRGTLIGLFYSVKGILPESAPQF
jgi:hypothetical protein